MPTDPAVEHVGAGRFQPAGQFDHLVGGTAVFDQIDHAHADGEQEIRADAPPYAANHLTGEAHAIAKVTAPAVLPLVGAQRQEGIDEVPFRGHHLDPVIAGLPGETGCPGIVLEGPLDIVGGHFPRRDGIDRGAQG